MSSHAFRSLSHTPFLPVPARPLRLGFLTPHDPADRTAFSGSVHFAARALAARPDVDLRILGRHSRPSRLGQFLGRKPLGPDPQQLDLEGLDAIVGMVATSLLDRLLPDPDLPPVLHVTDATPAFLKTQYGVTLPDIADVAERRVAQAAAAVVYSSAAMARRAPGDLDLPDLSPRVQAFGANLDHVPPEPPAKPRSGPIEILFAGLDWQRKGGDLAAAAVDLLRAQGHNVHLTAVGRRPSDPLPSCVTHLGFLDKNRPRDARKFATLMTRAHLLILPTRADCTPMVIAEAMAHGTPVIASDTGGIAAMIGGDGAGRTLPLTADASDWATAITAAIHDPMTRMMMSDAAFDRAGAVLSWDAWAAGIVTHAAALADATGKPQPAGNCRAGALQA